jgi:hypothetical protein
MNKVEIMTLHNAAIPGLRFRRWHDAHDYQQLAAVQEGSREWDRVDPLSARKGIPNIFYRKPLNA